MTYKDTRTSVPLTRETRDRLAEMGKKNETYDTLINRMIDHYYNFTINGNTQKKKKTRRNDEETIGDGLTASTSILRGRIK